MFRITIEEILDSQNAGDQGVLVKRLEQTVEVIDLRRVIDAINYKPRVYKPRASKSQA